MKELSLAIYWHMHQPDYKIEGTYLMPWTRLHAIKDYLDMVLFLDRYPNLKLNLDIVPALLDAITDYSNGINDIHSELTISDIKEMTKEEKEFILNNFFCPKYETMLYKSRNYQNLFKKRFGKDYCNIDEFSTQEFSDIMALFNLVWIDPIHDTRIPRLQELWEKQYNYTLEDRIEIINLQRQIISQIIPTYKRLLNENKIEITASTYYHAILPILCADKRTLSKLSPQKENLPNSLDMQEYATLQIKSALDKIEEIFGVRPKGFWLPELCIDSKSLNFLAKENIQWTIADEKALSESINFEFVRDFQGNLREPYHLVKVYEYNTKNTPLNIIFRDRSIPNLINFEYAGLDSNVAANDLYNKIKSIQQKLLVSPDKNHLITIALDGENCWENYKNDGNDFLESFYSKLEQDKTIKTVLISNYIKNDKNKKTISKIPLSSGIDNSFHYWISDPVKNKAWNYLQEAKKIIDKHASLKKTSLENIQSAKKELMIIQGSDWLWWYGKPNNSGQDYVFDYMFREHLKNIYMMLNVKVPDYINNSLLTSLDVPFKRPNRNISPKINGLSSSEKEWTNSGMISFLDGPVHHENKNINKINFGCDNTNIYFRLHINKNEHSLMNKITQFYIYLRNATKAGARAYVRLISKTDSQLPPLNEKFENELTVTFVKDTIFPPRLAKCLQTNMWTLSNQAEVDMAYTDVIDVKIPFDTIGINKGETVEFIMANTDAGVRNKSIPQDLIFTMVRN